MAGIEVATGELTQEHGRSCEFCKKMKNIFEFEQLEDWILGWGGGKITKDNAMYSNRVVFIDRGYLRLADPEDCGCMDHGEKIKIEYCPLCGGQLREE